MKIRSIEAFQVASAPGERPAQRSAWVRVAGEDGLFGIGEASPMQGGFASLGIIARDLVPALIGADPLDHAVLHDRLLHRFAKLGPEGALTGALAALDIALWDLKGKLLQQPIYKLLGGAWRTRLPFYASIGGNGERTLDEVVRAVETRLADRPAAVKIRFDADRTHPDRDIAGDIAKARAVRRLVGDGFPLAFDANNGYSMRVAIARVVVIAPRTRPRRRARGAGDQGDPAADRRAEGGSGPAAGRRSDRRPAGGAEQSAAERILGRIVRVGAGRKREHQRGNQTAGNSVHLQPPGRRRAAVL
jgi:L-alanine-DL-glutamate epimerase-like enolase superfamily enzyme